MMAGSSRGEAVDEEGSQHFLLPHGLLAAANQILRVLEMSAPHFSSSDHADHCRWVGICKETCHVWNACIQILQV